MTNGPTKTDLEQLKAMVGAAGWTTDPAVLESHVTEWRGLYRGATPLMLSPDSPGQAAAILSYCNERRLAVVPQGGNTGLSGGAIPGLDTERPEILLSARRLNKIHSIDPTNFTLTAGAGCILSSIQAAAANVDCLFPLSLAAEGSCQIGGNLATNAGGTNVLRYGNTRDLVLGLEVALPDGTIYSNLRGLRKDNTGYALDQLFIGAEGTLGFITAATLKLFPAPHGSATTWLAVNSPADAVRLFAAARAALGDELVAFELIPEIAVRFVVDYIAGRRAPLNNNPAWNVLLEVNSSRSAELLETAVTDFLTGQLDTGGVLDGVVAASGAQRDELWAIRHDISLAQKSAGASIKHDISVPISLVPEFLDRAGVLVSAVVPGIRPVPFGHLGDGNLHYNLSQPEEMSAEQFLSYWTELNEVVHSLAHELGGSFSAEHGIGALKAAELERLAAPAKLALMRAIKSSLDPNNIMNPGKVLKTQQD